MGFQARAGPSAEIKALGFSELFAGVIVVASLGNAAELIAAVRFARADKMDLASP